MDEFFVIGKSVPKIDSLSLSAGMEKFTDDFHTGEPLCTAILYSPVAHAEIVDIDTSAAKKIEGVVDILYYQNVPRVLHTTAGQGYPEPSPYDTLLFDRRVRFVGDRVALVAAETEQTAREALKKIQAEYKPLVPIFDTERATDPVSPRIHVDDE